jgi:hypothetical protein
MEKRMNEWNYDMDAAPKGRYVMRKLNTKHGLVDREVHEPDLIIATDGNIVTLTKWLPPITTGPEAHRRDGRWTMFATWQTPLAWMPWPKAPNATDNQEESANELL